LEIKIFLRRDGGINFILRIKEQETRLILHEHGDDDDDDDDDFLEYT
jgi:hypothetical protein